MRVVGRLLSAIFPTFPTAEVEFIDHGDPIVDEMWRQRAGMPSLLDVAPAEFWYEIEDAATA